jgi:Protein of unknown function (DUF3892)
VAAFQVTGVELSDSTDGGHQHISAVCIGWASTKIQKSMVVDDLRDPKGDRYYTMAGGERADIHVADCPYCDEGDYLTTSPDSTETNNLLSLPGC